MPLEEPVRRRSTVRERAPIGGAQAATANKTRCRRRNPSCRSRPAPEPVVTEISETAESRSAAPHRLVVAPFRRRLNGGCAARENRAWVERDAMKSEWVADAGAHRAHAFAESGIDRDLALRIYTTRLLGRDPKLVLHGGGNTSLKTRMRDRLGEEVEVLRVKASGSDMAAIETGRFRRGAARSDAQAARAQSNRRRGSGRRSNAPI